MHLVKDFYRISRDFADLLEFRGSATVRNFRSPAQLGGDGGFFYFPGSCEFKSYCFVLCKGVTENSGVACVVL